MVKRDWITFFNSMVALCQQFSRFLCPYLLQRVVDWITFSLLFMLSLHISVYESTYFKTKDYAII